MSNLPRFLAYMESLALKEAVANPLASCVLYAEAYSVKNKKTKFSDLPTELALIIFINFLGLFAAEPQEYARRRFIVRSVCWGWRHAGDGATVLWKGIYVAWTTTSATLTLSVARSQGIKIDICVDLSHSPEFPHSWHKVDIIYHTSYVMRVIRRHLSRTVTLTIHTDDDHAALWLQDYLSDFCVPVLRSLSINLIRRQPRLQSWSRPSVVHYVGSPRANLGVLQELHLTGVFPAWHPTITYSNLRRLSLEGLTGRGSIDWIDMVGLVAAVPRLEVLRLMRVECRVSLEHTMLAPLPFLTDLHISVSHPNSPTILSRMVAPVLSFLSLEALTDTDIGFFVLSAGIHLSQIASLSLAIASCNSDVIRGLLGYCFYVRHVDLTRCPPEVIDALHTVVTSPLPDNFPSPLLCPMLHTLLLPSRSDALLTQRNQFVFCSTFHVLVPAASGSRAVQYFINAAGGVISRTVSV
ncbi:hypothetical protein DFH06DRAFT_1318525 [Mycena polygramma]|nr:hypothetical protein DFH06DRAFT_1318525 [Mycena polygramma]